MTLVFDWDVWNRKHIARHNVTQEEAEQVVFNDPMDLTFQLEDEERTVQVGQTNNGRVLVVVTTWRGSKVRVVTAYDAPKRLREFYLLER